MSMYKKVMMTLVVSIMCATSSWAADTSSLLEKTEGQNPILTTNKFATFQNDQLLTDGALEPTKKEVNPSVTTSVQSAGLFSFFSYVYQSIIKAWNNVFNKMAKKPVEPTPTPDSDDIVPK